MYFARHFVSYYIWTEHIYLDSRNLDGNSPNLLYDHWNAHQTCMYVFHFLIDNVQKFAGTLGIFHDFA